MIRFVLSRYGQVGFSQFVFFLILVGLLSMFILSPILQVLYVAFTQDGSVTLFHLFSFFQRALFREAFFNSLFVGLMVVVFSSLIALPLAFFSVYLSSVLLLILYPHNHTGRATNISRSVLRGVASQPRGFHHPHLNVYFLC